MRYIPTISLKTRRDVFIKSEFGVALDGDFIVVVNPAEIRELQMPCDRGGLGRNSFHHVAVAANRVHVVIK